MPFYDLKLTIQKQGNLMGRGRETLVTSLSSVTVNAVTPLTGLLLENSFRDSGLSCRPSIEPGQG